MLKRLEIDPEFQNLIRPLTPDEYKNLEEQLVDEGCRDELIIWEDVIIDGHNRYEICQKHEIPFKTKEMFFDDRSEVIVWMIKHQFGQRNLQQYERSVLSLRYEEELKKMAKENQVASGENFGKGLTNLSKPIETINTRKEVAKIAGVSEGTIAKVKVIEAKATPEQKEALLSGKKRIDRIYKDIKEDETGTKVCNRCGEEKPLSEFYKDGDGYISNPCKKCKLENDQRKKSEQSAPKLTLEKINEIYDGMKNPASRSDQGTGESEKFCNSIISEFEEIIKCFAADINKFLFSEEQMSEAPTGLKKIIELTIDDLNKINKFIKE